MSWYRASLQTLGAILLLALVLACHGKSKGSTNPNTATISGTVSYLRVPLVKDANGVPTGLADATNAANLVSMTARGIYVRIYQQLTETRPDGTTTSAWVLAASSYTGTTGDYSATVTKGRPTMVELSSAFNAGSGQLIQLIAEPQGIASTTTVNSRKQYALRKAVDGTSVGNAPVSMLAGDSVVNFTVGLDDEWWITYPAVNTSTGMSEFVDQAKLETDPSIDPARVPGKGTGSRVLGIGDTIAGFMTVYGIATPGDSLDLHYWPGVDSGGSYVVYDWSLNPLTKVSSRFFGTLRGGPANDDAWDEGVILTMMARNVLYGGNRNRAFSMPLNPLFPPGVPLIELSPDLARIEGLAQTMAANLLQCPFLADTQGTGLAALVDVRDISTLSPAQLGPYSAPAIRAFAWELILKANSLPSPGVASDWAKINPLASARFFLAPGATGTTANGTAADLEPLNIFSQIGRLKEGNVSTEPVVLATVFTDAGLTSLGAPFNLPWPRPTVGAYASFATSWGTDPTGDLPSVSLSMASATPVNGAFLNITPDETVYAMFNLTADKRCVLSARISPALPPLSQVEVDLPMMARTFSFTGDGLGQNAAPIVIPVYGTVPSFHPVRIHLRSASALPAPVTVTLTLTPAP